MTLPLAAFGVVVALMLAAPAFAQDSADARTGGGPVVLIHHPYPDSADPLGFPYPTPGPNRTGYYQQRYRPCMMPIRTAWSDTIDKLDADMLALVGNVLLTTLEDRHLVKAIA